MNQMTIFTCPAKTLWTISLFCLAFKSLDAQQLPMKREVADQYFSKFNYDGASKIYEKLAKKKNRSPLYARRLVDCYQHLRNYPKFLLWSRQAVRLKDENPSDHYYFGQALQANGKYDSARIEYAKGKGAAFVDSTLIANNISGCIFAAEASLKNPLYKVSNVFLMNSRFSDFSPTTLADTILFVSDRPSSSVGKSGLSHMANTKLTYGWTGNAFLKVYKVDAQNGPELIGHHGVPKNQSKVATAPGSDSLKNISLFVLKGNIGFHNGPIVFNREGTRMYFTRTSEADEGKRISKAISVQDSQRYFRTLPTRTLKNKNYDLSITHVDRLELWYALKVNEIWQNPRPFPFNSSLSYSIAHPALSLDGQVLYFTSDMPGGVGGYDLYYSILQSDTMFTKPQNMRAINTAGDDEFPSIGKNNRLYFASNGRPGFGGLDLFEATGQKSQWQNIQNLGLSINSNKDDFGLVVTDSLGNRGLFSSNREGGVGSDDIYTFQRNQTRINVLVKNAQTLVRIPLAGVELAEAFMPVLRVLTDTLGQGNAQINTGSQFIVKTEKPGFHDTTVTILANSEQLIKDTLTILLRPVEIKKDKNPTNQPIHTIYYAFDKSILRPEAISGLDSIIRQLSILGKYKILISSFADVRGSDLYNYSLSQKRSKSAYTYFIHHGVAKEAIQMVWFGDRKPINKCQKGTQCSETEFQFNRRSEIQLIPL